MRATSPPSSGGRRRAAVLHRAPGRPSIEDKAVAIADRDLTRFEKFAGNPVLPKPGPLDFCDRRVIRHAPTERWIMVTHGQPTGFYSSPDALTWQFESEFAATTPGLTPAPANR